MPTCSCQQTRNFPIRDRLSTMSWLLLRWSHTFTKVPVYSTKCANNSYPGSRYLARRRISSIVVLGRQRRSPLGAQLTSRSFSAPSKKSSSGILTPSLMSWWSNLLILSSDSQPEWHTGKKKWFLFYYLRNQLDLVATHPIYLQTCHRVWLWFWY